MRTTATLKRRAAVAIPARNEVATIEAAVAAVLNGRPADALTTVHVLANNCTDGTAECVRRAFAGEGRVAVHEAALPPERAHAGWSRRLALEAAARSLDAPSDVLMTTDADTEVATDWLLRTLAHLDSGYDAVAGWADVRLAALPPGPMRTRWGRLRRYQLLLAALRATPADPWPRHDYEGGASFALTLAAYRGIAPVPTPACGEDRALMAAVRAAGGRVRHALDVRVRTSTRVHGRACGGMADTVAAWAEQDEADPIHEAWPLNVELGLAPRSGRGLVFADLPDEIAKAQALLRARQAPLALSA